MVNLIHKDLSFVINGILFSIHNDLGKYASEKQVSDLFEKKLKEINLGYKREYVLPFVDQIEKPGRHRIDFLIDTKIVIEIKYKNFLQKEDYAQIRRYLKALNLALGILVNFREIRLHPKRVLNGSGKE